MELKKKSLIILGYLTRAILAYVYIPHGLEKLYTKINPQEYLDFKLGQEFINFYLIWERSGFIWVIGIVQFIGGMMLVFKRTYLFGAIFLFPVSVGMLCCHIFISHAIDFLIFDAFVLLLNSYLILVNAKALNALFFKQQSTWI